MREGSSARLPGGSWLTSELGTRVASAIVLAVVALALAYVGGRLFAALWLGAGVAVALEWIVLTGCEPRSRLAIAAVAGLAAVAAAAAVGSAAIGAAIGGAALLALLVIGGTSRDRAWAASGFVYAAVIAVVPPLVRAHPGLGLVGIVWMFAVVWATDIAAYFTGRALGGPKLWPAVSPRKTWSGFLGGLVAGTAAGALVAAEAGRWGWESPLPTPVLILACATASVLSQLGDLGESGLKRAFAVKDSGHLIPGHGGVMDRLDGFWAVAALLGVVLATRSV